MSEFGKTFFEGSPTIRWTVGPIALFAAAAFPLLSSDASGKRLVLLLVIELALILLALTVFAPVRFAWAGRALAALVFLAYLGYFIDMVLEEPDSFWPPRRRSDATGFSSVLGLLIIGYPALKYALTGRFAWRRPQEVDADRREDGPS